VSNDSTLDLFISSPDQDVIANAASGSESAIAARARSPAATYRVPPRQQIGSTRFARTVTAELRERPRHRA